MVAVEDLAELTLARTVLVIRIRCHVRGVAGLEKTRLNQFAPPAGAREKSTTECLAYSHYGRWQSWTLTFRSQF